MYTDDRSVIYELNIYLIIDVYIIETYRGFVNVVIIQVERVRGMYVR